jgi:hypothetical protein
MSSFTIPALFALPTELIIDIFSRWLTIIDWSSFDTALLTHHQDTRKRYLTILRSYPWHSFKHKGRQSAGLIRFLLARQVSVDCLELKDCRGQFPSLLPSTSVNKVSSLLRTVQNLHFDYASGLSLDWLKSLLLNGDLSQLQSLAITGFKKADDKLLLPILSACASSGGKKIKSFDFSGCWVMSDKVLDVLGKQFSLTLENINLSACFNLTSIGLQHFAQRVLALKSFTAAFVEQVDDEVLMTLTEHCQQLQYLDLNGCTNLTDESIIVMATNAKELKTVYLSGARFLTDTALHSLSTLPSLQDLNMESCTKISQAGVSNLIANCSTLRTLLLRHCFTATIAGPKAVGKAVRSASLTDEQFEELAVTVY